MDEGLRQKRKNLREKFRNILSLSLFIISAMLITIVIMDITAYPISLFAVYKRKVFNFIIRDLLIFVILVLFIIRTIKKIKKMKDEGFSAKAISEHFLKKTISMGSAFMAIVITFSIIVIALYYLLNLNQYFLYKITN